MPRPAYTLFLDESGKASFKTGQELYIRCGVLVKPGQHEILDKIADQIKYKFWNRTDIVFHSKEIGWRTSVFEVLKNPDVEKAFHEDLIRFLQTGPRAIAVVADNTAYQRRQKSERDVLRESALALIRFFTAYLAKNHGHGNIVIESSGSADDLEFYWAYNHVLGRGVPEFEISPVLIRELLTSLCFVTKANRDIGTQIADLLSYPASLQARIDRAIRPPTIVPKSYEDRMLALLKEKLVDIGFKHGNTLSSLIYLP